jgi:death on curing protein
VQEPIWLVREAVDDMHAELIAEHGGAAGVRHGGDDLIESALTRPWHRYRYENAGLFELAAAYLFGLAKNHGYLDGNKRIGFAAAVSFLDMNGIALTASEPDAHQCVIAVVEGRLTEHDLSLWIESHSEPTDPA